MSNLVMLYNRASHIKCLPLVVGKMFIYLRQVSSPKSFTLGYHKALDKKAEAPSLL